MCDLLSDLEKAVDELVEKHVGNEEERRSINYGEQSGLLEKYGLDFGTSSNRWCFRSAKRGSLTKLRS